jgi:hypothetical protein
MSGQSRADVGCEADVEAGVPIRVFQNVDEAFVSRRAPDAGNRDAWAKAIQMR